jgi:4-amino-4-deoxy-L-arabinose transferase-like glycosyltransferase
MTSLRPRPKLPAMQRPLRTAFVAAALAALVTVPGLGNGTLWDNSETAYGEVAREILLTHDWVVLHFNGSPWFIQPPLYFWLAAICARIFGISSFALRLPSAFATIAMGGMTAYAAARQAGARAGLYAGAILSTSLMQAIVGRMAIMDALLNLAVAFTIFWWFRALQSGRDRYFVYGSIAAGLGFLAKGPVAPVIALLVIVPYYFWERRASNAHVPSWRGWAAGAGFFIAIVAPWFGALVAATGARSVMVLIGHYTVGRYTGTIENQSGPLWYYIPVFILGFFPWVAFLPSAIAFAVAAVRRNSQPPGDPAMNQTLRLALVWTVMPFLFFSFARTKLPNYVALEFPALAVLVALYFDDAVERLRSRSALISMATVPVFIALLAFAIVVFSRDNRLGAGLHGFAVDAAGMGAAVFVGSVSGYFALLAGRRARPAAPYLLAVSMVFAIGFLALLALPETERFKPIPHLARIIESQRRPGDTVASLDVAGGNALIFYTRPPVRTLGKGGKDRRIICGSSRTWLVDRSGVPPPQYARPPELIARYDKDDLYLYLQGDCGKGS